MLCINHNSYLYCCCVSIIIVICICPPGALIWLINLFYSILYKIHVTLQCIVVSALKKTSKVNTILKVVIFKHSVILFRCDLVDGQNHEILKPAISGFYIRSILYIGLVITSHENRWRHFTDNKSCQIIDSILKYKNGFKNNLMYKEIFN